MISTGYLQTIAQDLYSRIGSIVLNDTITVPIRSLTINDKLVSVRTNNAVGITKVTKIALLDKNGGLIDEKQVNLDIPEQRQLEFTFRIEARGGTI
jgi:hypothetical protein